MIAARAAPWPESAPLVPAPAPPPDANDAAQFAELLTQGELTRRAWERNVQVRVCPLPQAMYSRIGAPNPLLSPWTLVAASS